MRKIVVATGNPGKVTEMQEYLHNLPWELQLKPQELDIEETGATFLENAGIKAAQVAIAVGEWAIADDSGLAVDALDGAPGLYSARYGNTDAERIERLLRELGDRADRGAQFICAVAIASPDGTIVEAVQGECPGEILREMKGSGGFGYDPIFYVPEYQKTFAQMSPDLKNRISHRGKAFEQLLPRLEKHKK